MHNPNASLVSLVSFSKLQSHNHLISLQIDWDGTPGLFAHVDAIGMGCAKDVRRGRVQPNEHGTWYTGRNGWCNGADVPVRQFDVTAAATASKSDDGLTNVSYHAYGPNGKEPGQANSGGNIVLSSVLAWTY